MRAGHKCKHGAYCIGEIYFMTAIRNRFRIVVTKYKAATPAIGQCDSTAFTSCFGFAIGWTITAFSLVTCLNMYRSAAATTSAGTPIIMMPNNCSAVSDTVSEEEGSAHRYWNTSAAALFRK